MSDTQGGDGESGARASGGYVKMYRRLYEHPAFRTKQEASVFAWMVAVSNWKTNRIFTECGPVELKIGELIIGERVLAEDFGLHRNTVRSLLARMEHDGIITLIRDRAPRSVGTIVRVNKYEQYQSNTGKPENVQDQQSEDAGTKVRPPQDRYGTNTNKGNEGKKIKNKKDDRPTADSSDGEPSDGASVDVPDGVPAQADLLDTATIVPIRKTDDTKLAVALWNALAIECDLSQVSTSRPLSDQRRRALSARLRDAGGIDGWKVALQRIRENDYLRGATGKGWAASFDFMLQPASFTKLMEDAYRQRRVVAPARKQSALEEAADRYGYGSARPADSQGAHFADEPFTIDGEAQSA